MKIGVPRGVVFVAALVAVVIPVSRYAYTWFRDISADKHIRYGRLEHPESSTDPQVLLSEADRLYWLNNGPEAAPLYAKAEICWVYLPLAIRSRLPENARAVASLPAESSRWLSIEVFAGAGTLPLQGVLSVSGFNAAASSGWFG